MSKRWATDAEPTTSTHAHSSSQVTSASTSEPLQLSGAKSIHSQTWSNLTFDIADHILHFLSSRDHMICIDLVSRHWKSVAQRSRVWNQFDINPSHNWLNDTQLDMTTWIDNLNRSRPGRLQRLSLILSDVGLGMTVAMKTCIAHLELAGSYKGLSMTTSMFAADSLRSIRMEIRGEINVVVPGHVWHLPIRTEVHRLMLAMTDKLQKRPLRIYTHWCNLTELSIDGQFDLVGVPASLPNIKKCDLLLGHNDACYGDIGLNSDRYDAKLLRQDFLLYEDTVIRFICAMVPLSCSSLAIGWPTPKIIDTLLQCYASTSNRLQQLHLCCGICMDNHTASVLFSTLHTYMTCFYSDEEKSKFMCQLQYFHNLDSLNLGASTILITTADIQQILHGVPNLKVLNLSRIVMLDIDSRKCWKVPDLRQFINQQDKQQSVYK